MASGFKTWLLPHFLVLLLVLAGCGSDSGGSGFLIDNQAPVAIAGADQNVTTSSEVTLDGSTSTDPDGDELVFLWETLSLPPQSTATLSDPAAPVPVFIADLPEAYVFRLTVTDPLGETSNDLVVVTAYAAPRVNTPPTALIASLSDSPVGTMIPLDGSGSADADPGDSLTYRWELTPPSGSHAVLTGSSTSLPTLTPDVPGSYLLTLRVTDTTGAEAFTAAQLTAVLDDVTPIAPVANAGADQTAEIDAVILLDGSASRDANGDSLSYFWSFTFRPQGSRAQLINPSSPQPYFVADLAGTYLVGLTVHDGALSSSIENVKIDVAKAAVATSVAPVAAAGPDQNGEVTDVLLLDGTASNDANGDPLTYSWSFASRPEGSTARLTNPDSSQPFFTADLAGTYILSLTVNDGELESPADHVKIVIAAGAP